MRTALGLVLTVPLLAALACGGRVDGIGGGGGSCPAASAIVDGGSCTVDGKTCPWIETTCANLSCTCTGGSWACEHSNGPACQVCPAQAQAGGSCTAAEQGCQASATITLCGAPATISCECQSSSWVCEGTLPECPDAQACPSPASIEQAGVCSTPPTTSCESDIAYYDCQGDVVGYASCTCGAGRWSCPLPGTPACPDGGGPCPQPIDVVQDTGCFTDGQQCPGNPQTCGGQVLYDAFECQGGLWQDVAVTFCDVDGGGGGSVDAGQAGD